VKIAPPLTIPQEALMEGLSVLEEALDEAVEEQGQDAPQISGT